MWKIIGSAALGFLLANIINFIEINMIMKVMKNSEKTSRNIEKMLKEFKLEGDDDKWMK